MAEMKCNGGKYTVLLDDEDWERIKEYHWIVNLCGGSLNPMAFRRINYSLQSPDNRRKVYLHHELIEAWGMKRDGHYPKWLNANTLDCRKDNLVLSVKKPEPIKTPRVKGPTYHEHMQCPGYRRCMALFAQHRVRTSQTYRESRRIYTRERVKTNIYYRIRSRIASRITAALMGREKAGKTCELLGCSINEYRAYLTGLFKPDMSWDNYGKTWNIDHVKPCRAHNLSNPEEQRACFHYSNTRPEYVDTNSSKGARWNGKDFAQYNTKAMHEWQRVKVA